MLLRRKIVNQVIRSIQSDPNFKTVYEIARKNADGPVYLVGGRVYRSLIENIHGYDCASSKADWDFLVLGGVKVRNSFIPEGWGEPDRAPKPKRPSPTSMWRAPTIATSSGISAPRISTRNKKVKANSLTLVNHSLSVFGPVKIDLIAIKDIVMGTKDGYHVGRFNRALQKSWGLNEYFDAVPLDIQALALDLEDKEIHASRALKAIQTKVLRVNNPKGALPDLKIGSYIDRKASSIRFTYDYILDTKIPCSCFKAYGIHAGKELMNSGCQLPNAHR